MTAALTEVEGAAGMTKGLSDIQDVATPTQDSMEAVQTINRLVRSVADLRKLLWFLGLIAVNALGIAIAALWWAV